MKQNELSRFKEMIVKDRIEISENFDELLKKDLIKTLNEYFEIKDVPIIKISKCQLCL